MEFRIEGSRCRGGNDGAIRYPKTGGCVALHTGFSFMWRCTESIEYLIRDTPNLESDH